ncbi:ABC transporter ATP-binding protein [Treponema sp. OMZ 792]|uniref:ABC transporter ATP-binding protein n=1 Tax=unclassified Treponema TaxID=2638727 RepID=UPI0020A4485C|nr:MULTISPECIES: ABC transporter ATP-binding protein [unclassified Treponema]UTC75021.1 ABC transporter ATP-binding protein [Treponema sp. OMZ 792]UTC76629.1 ABC transporter ATP-binding protein [Treponema sp. OMZ 799]UTC81416.1 ABC transporter ATP-binding protein [Treponema sp. OMZ 798]
MNEKEEKKAPKKVKQPGVVTRILAYAGKHKPLIYLSLFCSALSTIALLIPYALVFYVMRDIISAYMAGTAVDLEQMMVYGGTALAAAAVGFLLYFAALMCSHITAFNLMGNMNMLLTDTFARLPVGWHTAHSSGAVRKVFEKNVHSLEALIAHMLPDVVQNAVSPIAVLFLMFFFDWRFGLISFLPLVIAFVLQGVFMAKGQKSGFMENYENALEKMNSAGTEYIRGISVVKTFNQSVHRFKDFYTSIINYRDYVLKYSMSWENGFSMFLALLKTGFVLLVPAAIIFAGTAAQGEGYTEFLYGFIFYLSLSPVMLNMMIKIIYGSSLNMQGGDALNRIEAILSEKAAPEPEKSIMPQRFDIAFKDVVFSYQDAEKKAGAEEKTAGSFKKAINGISLNLSEHSLTALVGPSGGGKTTLVNLLGRFWELDSGEITIGGVNIKDIKTDDLMHLVSFVFQENKLFKESIFENIRYGKKDATREEVLAVLEKAECMDIIEKLPNGIDTVYGTKGTYVSGGEAQRLAVARSLLQDAPIVVLDEATSFADAENEHKIKKTFSQLLTNKTVIMIAHRLSSVVNADKICVINNGKVEEIGTHAELSAKGGLYSKMWNNFQSGISWKLNA